MTMKMKIIPAMRDALCFVIKVKKKKKRDGLFIGICLWGNLLLYIDSPYFMKIRAKIKC